MLTFDAQMYINTYRGMCINYTFLRGRCVREGNYLIGELLPARGAVLRKAVQLLEVGRYACPRESCSANGRGRRIQELRHFRGARSCTLREMWPAHRKFAKRNVVVHRLHLHVVQQL